MYSMLLNCSKNRILGDEKSIYEKTFAAQKMNGDKRGSISIIDPESSSSLHKRLSHTLESIRSQLQTRGDVTGRRSVDSPRTSETLSRARQLNKQLCVARIREANLQDEIDNMKNEIAERNKQIAELRQYNDQLKAQINDARLNQGSGIVELRGGLQVVNDKLKLQAELLNSSITERGSFGDKEPPTPPVSSRSMKRSMSSHQTGTKTIILNQRSYLPKTCPIRLTSSYIPDISRHFRNARVVTASDPLFRVHSKS